MGKTRCGEGSIFHKVVRLRSVKECPLMLETSYLPKSRFDAIDISEFVSDSMYEFLKKNYQFAPARATEQFQPVMPTPYEKELLQIYGNTPCMLLERFTFEGEELGEYTRSVIRGDKYVFRVELE